MLAQQLRSHRGGRDGRSPGENRHVAAGAQGFGLAAIDWRRGAPGEIRLERIGQPYQRGFLLVGAPLEHLAQFDRVFRRHHAQMGQLPKTGQRGAGHDLVVVRAIQRTDKQRHRGIASDRYLAAVVQSRSAALAVTRTRTGGLLPGPGQPTTARAAALLTRFARPDRLACSKDAARPSRRANGDGNSWVTFGPSRQLGTCHHIQAAVRVRIRRRNRDLRFSNPCRRIDPVPGSQMHKHRAIAPFETREIVGQTAQVGALAWREVFKPHGSAQIDERRGQLVRVWRVRRIRPRWNLAPPDPGQSTRFADCRAESFSGARRRWQVPDFAHARK